MVYTSFIDATLHSFHDVKQGQITGYCPERQICFLSTCITFTYLTIPSP